MGSCDAWADGETRLGLTCGRVADVMVRTPKTLPADARVAHARAALDDDHVHMVLLTDRGRLVGTLHRSDLPGDGEAADDGLGAEAALTYAVVAGRTVSPHRSAEEARQILIRGSQRRLAVVDPKGALLGLLCLKGKLTGFCSDADVADRATDNPPLESTCSPSSASRPQLNGDGGALTMG